MISGYENIITQTTKDRVTQPSLKPGVNLCAPDGCAVPASKLLQSTLLYPLNLQLIAIMFLNKADLIKTNSVRSVAP